MRIACSIAVVLSVLCAAEHIVASDPPPAPQSGVLTLDGKPILPSDAVLPLPPSPDLPPPLTAPTAGAKIEAPPVPPGPTWIVRAYEWINNGWVMQPNHCFETTDLKQAADYCLVLSRYQNWFYQSNVPLPCCDPSIKPFAVIPNSASLPNDLPHLTLTVWAFKFDGGKWVKDEQYCWSASDYYSMRSDMLAYAKKLNAIPGWCATTNAPDWVGGKPRPSLPSALRPDAKSSNTTGDTPPAAPDTDRATIDAQFIAAFVDNANSAFHGPLQYSSDPNDPVNGYNTLHRPSGSYATPVYCGPSGCYINGYYGSAGYYHH